VKKWVIFIKVVKSWPQFESKIISLYWTKSFTTVYSKLPESINMCVFVLLSRMQILHFFLPSTVAVSFIYVAIQDFFMKLLSEELFVYNFQVKRVLQQM